jgi:hypothetical protein
MHFHRKHIPYEIFIKSTTVQFYLCIGNTPFHVLLEITLNKIMNILSLIYDRKDVCHVPIFNFNLAERKLQKHCGKKILSQRS